MALIKALVNGIVALGGGRAAQNAQVLGGIEGEVLVSELHGRRAINAVAKRRFIASTALAGVTIPVNAASLVSVFTLFNPASSGVNMELDEFKLGVAGTTTAVIGDLALAYQFNGAALASLTAGTIQSALVGSGATSKVNFYTAATYTGTPSILDFLGVGFGTTGATPGPTPVFVDLDGIVIPPNCSVTVVGNVAQTQPFDISLGWSETPV